MTKKVSLAIFALLLVIILTYSIIHSRELKANICSSEWYSIVENKIMTGDGHGHGPDPGSTEWRSVVEFKLGIRGEKKVPSRQLDLWCNYINTNYIESGND